MKKKAPAKSKSSAKHNKNTAKRKPPATAWKPGQSGNPHGRPKTGEAFAEIVRDFMAELDPKSKKGKIQTLLEKAFKNACGSRKDACKWAELIINRGWQKLAEKHELEGNVGDAITAAFAKRQAKSEEEKKQNEKNTDSAVTHGNS